MPHCQFVCIALILIAHMMNETITNLEAHLGLGATDTAKVLGYPYNTYAQYKNGTRRIKSYLYHHILAIMFIPEDDLKIYISEALRGYETAHKG